MGQFDGLKQAELQAACRDRGLSAAGSNAEMLERLVEFEALTSDGEAGATPVVVGQPSSDVPPAPPQEEQPPAPPAPTGTEVDLTADPKPEPAPERQATLTRPGVPTTTFRVRYSCPAGLSTGLHEEFRRMALIDAAKAGHATKGGAARIGFETIGGVQHAVYEVAIRTH